MILSEREVEKNRTEFPLISQNNLIYFDNAATMQSPRVVNAAVQRFNEKQKASPLRGMYDLAVQATERLETAREVVAEFLGAKKNEIIFTKNATESLNQAARGLKNRDNQKVVTTILEHHSNLLPWAQTGQLQVMRCDRSGKFAAEELAKIDQKTALVTVTGMSNVTGVKSDLKLIGERAREEGALMMVDATQLVAHQKLDVGKLGADLLAFSGHKIGAPMGVGVLFMKETVQEKFRPLLWGGGGVESVKLNAEETLEISLKNGVQKYEAGTLNIDGILGLQAMIEYLKENKAERLYNYIDELGEYMMEELKKVPGIELLAGEHGLAVFNISDVHPHDTAAILAAEGIAVRAGYHCAQPLLDYWEIGPVVRASLTFYNTKREVDEMMKVLKTVQQKMMV